MNIYYEMDKLGIEVLEFNEPDMGYEFNTLLFIRSPDGRVFVASDSGCSCPTPFEDYEGETLNDILPLLERVGSVEHGLASFDSWNRGYDDKPFLSISSRMECESKLKEWLR